MTSLVQVDHQDDVAVVTLNHPPVNALSQDLCRALLAAVRTEAAKDTVRAIVITGGGSTFSGGADISEFGALRERGPGDEFPMHDMINGIEACDKPVIAAIHGNALGGGLETALGCHYRIATPTARIGLPEVKLGLIPGAMGTQRLPRLCGIPKAAEIAASGTMIPAAEAVELGIIDRLAEGDLVAGFACFLLLGAARRFFSAGSLSPGYLLLYPVDSLQDRRDDGRHPGSSM